jgi:hypothetical protein
LSEISNIIAVISLVIALVSALFTGWGVHVSKETAQKQLRAYVYVGGNNQIEVEAGKINKIPLDIVNVGQTPAINVAVFSRGFRELNKTANSWEWNPSPEVLCKDTSKASANIGYIPRKVRKEFQTDQPLTIDDDIAKLAHIYALGTVCYEDIYSQKHWVRFCLQWPAKNVGNEPAACDKHNDTGSF